MHRWARDKDGTAGQVPATHVPYVSTFTNTTSLYLQQEFHPGRGSRAHPGHWHRSVLPKQLTETWTAAGQHNWPKENKCNVVPAGLYS